MQRVNVKPMQCVNVTHHCKHSASGRCMTSAKPALTFLGGSEMILALSKSHFVVVVVCF